MAPWSQQPQAVGGNWQSSWKGNRTKAHDRPNFKREQHWVPRAQELDCGGSLRCPTSSLGQLNASLREVAFLKCTYSDHGTSWVASIECARCNPHGNRWYEASSWEVGDCDSGLDSVGSTVGSGTALASQIPKTNHESKRCPTLRSARNLLPGNRYGLRADHWGGQSVLGELWRACQANRAPRRPE